MNYTFFGTPDFAAIILEKLIDAGYAPKAVVCNPDRPAGRKKIITPPPVKRLIAKSQLPIEILQPENITAISHELYAAKPDVFVVAAYAKILPKEILAIPRLGTIGVHPSLLPKYRGPTPIQNAILSGAAETGVTLFLMDEKVDHGPLIAASHLPLAAGETCESLSRKLAKLAGDLLTQTLQKFIKGEVKAIPQNESQAIYTKKFGQHDGYIEPQGLKKAQEVGGEIAFIIERKIKALNPEPGVWTRKNGKRLKLLDAEIKNKKLILKRIQEEGKKQIQVSLENDII